MDSSARGNPVTEAIDGASGDWSMSGDAMRWSPDLVERSPANGELGGLESGSGVGPVLALDVAAVRRLVGGALSSLGTVATDVVSELRQLTRGPSSEDPAGPRPED
ncbi:hypothetical protein [Blastococcus capsensis]|uniref:hypothetical protein n=1 Tax=Blastococcus capsensis TaxID=1564163 RepID=UPI002540F6DD|nr:hypothetical protein [Blastococcus capsensis]MDK3258860.1 hypothetical protein [Blastococcus capsensis]